MVRASGDDATTLPGDPAALRALLLAALGKCDALAAERDALAARNGRLRHLLARLKRMQFGRKSERLPDEQLHFAFEELEASVAPTRPRPRSARRSCAASAPRRAARAAGGCRRTCRA